MSKRYYNIVITGKFEYSDTVKAESKSKAMEEAMDDFNYDFEQILKDPELGWFKFEPKKVQEN